MRLLLMSPFAPVITDRLLKYFLEFYATSQWMNPSNLRLSAGRACAAYVLSGAHKGVEFKFYIYAYKVLR